MNTEVQRLIAKEELIQEELVKLAVTDPHTATILLRFCVGPRLTYWLRTLPLHRAALLADLKDKLTLRTAERVVLEFNLQSSAELRQYIHSLIFTSPLAWGAWDWLRVRVCNPWRWFLPGPTRSLRSSHWGRAPWSPCAVWSSTYHTGTEVSLLLKSTLFAARHELWHRPIWYPMEFPYTGNFS